MRVNEESRCRESDRRRSSESLASSCSGAGALEDNELIKKQGEIVNRERERERGRKRERMRKREAPRSVSWEEEEKEEEGEEERKKKANHGAVSCERHQLRGD